MMLSKLTGSLLGGTVREGVTQATGLALSGYLVVFGIEAAILVFATVMRTRSDVSAFKKQAVELSFVGKLDWRRRNDDG